MGELWEPEEAAVDYPGPWSAHSKPDSDPVTLVCEWAQSQWHYRKAVENNPGDELITSENLGI